ncbi:MAG: hypothetical protein ABI411_10780 [Tahibacter sp.]
MNSRDRIPARVRANSLQCLALGLIFAAHAGATSPDIRLLAIAANAATVPAVGKPLPAGGGDPGKVYLANLAARQRGDLEGILATESAYQVAQMRSPAHRDEIAVMVEMNAKFAPRSATIRGGREFAERAELEIDEIDSDGRPFHMTAIMTRERGQWKMTDPGE